MAARPSPAAINWREALGRKVTLRYKLPPGSSHSHSEAIGVISSVEGPADDPVISVMARTGEVVQVPVSRMTHARVFTQ